MFGELTFSHTSDKSEEDCNLLGQLFDSLLSECVCVCVCACVCCCKWQDMHLLANFPRIVLIIKDWFSAVV